ncbi:MAG: hypothetical protein SCK29_14485 [Bacillota bacterium]|nr:hypothetical protein [Bacillota bacterium]MDW7685308.1 hypothetical protein [Bacillota bacterium]
MFNPFEQKPMLLGDAIKDWQTVYPKSYDKNSADPYTKIRVILMNGIKVASALSSHEFHRHCTDNELRRDLAFGRRIDQQQQKMINWLPPVGETPLETTIGYEHVAVDLTAWLAMNEPDFYVKETMDLALLEDFDHLYRYSNLMDLDKNIPAQNIVKQYVEITPGRPTMAHHRHPSDTVRGYINFKSADIRTKLNILTITAAEQQTMNFYMNIGPTYYNDLGRQLYQEIAMVEEVHVTQYGSLIDPNCTWLEMHLLHKFNECYLFYSFYQDEKDPHIKSIWEMCLEQEIAQLHRAAALLAQHENKQWQQVVGDGTFPKLLQFHQTKDYLRKVLAETVENTGNKEVIWNVNDLPDNHTFFWYQDRINHDVKSVPSHMVIAQHQMKNGQDYRYEDMPNPIESLRDRRHDNVSLGRTKQRQLAGVH